MASDITLKVLSYNVFMRDLGGDFLGIKATILDILADIGRGLGLTDANVDLELVNKKRAELIGQFIAQGDYDVVVFQEAFDDGAREKLRENVARGGFTHATGVVGDDSFSGSDGGIFIMSKWPFLDGGQIVYVNGIGDDKRAQKGVSWAVIEKDGFPFHVFGTHTQSGASHASYRSGQFLEFRKMMDKVGLFWLPALLAGDFNVDYANAPERESMLSRLQAALPENRSRHTPTSDPANELISDSQQPTTLDYVLFANDPQPSPFRPRPKSSSLETIKFRTPYTVFPAMKYRPKITLNDLSDHYAVLGTFTFERPRQDWRRLAGTWKSVILNNQPDPRNWRITFDFLGRNIQSVINGKVFEASIHQITPGPEIRGEIVFWNRTVKRHEKFFYAIGQNNDFKKYFQPLNKLPNRPPALNELMLRNADGSKTTLFAFESYLPYEPWERPDRP